MINFVCQVGRATGYPDIWLNVILGTFVKVFLGVISMWICRVQQIALPNGGRSHPSHWRSAENKKADPTLRKREFFLRDDLQAGTSVFFLLLD